MSSAPSGRSASTTGGPVLPARAGLHAPGADAAPPQPAAGALAAWVAALQQVGGDDRRGHLVPLAGDVDGLVGDGVQDDRALRVPPQVQPFGQPVGVGRGRVRLGDPLDDQVGPAVRERRPRRDDVPVGKEVAAGARRAVEAHRAGPPANQSGDLLVVTGEQQRAQPGSLRCRGPRRRHRRQHRQQRPRIAGGQRARGRPVPLRHLKHGRAVEQQPVRHQPARQGTGVPQGAHALRRDPEQARRLGGAQCISCFHAHPPLREGFAYRNPSRNRVPHGMLSRASGDPPARPRADPLRQGNGLRRLLTRGDDGGQVLGGEPQVLPKAGVLPSRSWVRARRSHAEEKNQS